MNLSVVFQVRVLGTDFSGFARLAFLELCLLFLDIGAKDAHFVVLVLLEIEPELFAEPQLQEVVVQGLLRHPHLLGSVFERVPKQVSFVVVHTVVEFPPETHLLDDLLNRPFLGALLLVHMRVHLGISSLSVPLYDHALRLAFNFLNLLLLLGLDPARLTNYCIQGILLL